MIEKIRIEYWGMTGWDENRTQHVFDVEVRKDMWDSLSDAGREQFLKEQLWEDLKCGYRVVEPETKRS